MVQTQGCFWVSRSRDLADASGWLPAKSLLAATASGDVTVQLAR